MFINYNVNYGIRISSYREPQGYFNSGVTGLVDDIVAERDGCCPLEGALELLESDIWQGSNATTEILEEIVQAIENYERELNAVED